MVEQATHNRQATGSNPVGATLFPGCEEVIFMDFSLIRAFLGPIFLLVVFLYFHKGLASVFKQLAETNSLLREILAELKKRPPD